MATYVALSTENATALGWGPYGLGATANEARAEADAVISRREGVYRQTLERNLVVISESRAKREGFLQRDRFVARCPDHGLYLTGGRQDDPECRCPGYHEEHSL